MAEFHTDQADGLRRMFRSTRLRMIHIVAGRADVGRTTVAVNLACALARAGRETLLADCIDAGATARAFAYLGLQAPAPRAPGGVLPGIAPGPHGLGVVALEAAALRGGRDDVGQRSALCAGLIDYAADLDFLLASSRAVLPLDLLPVADDRREVVVVLSRAASSITQAYALIKALSTAGSKRRFQVLVNRVASDAEAALIYRNMAAVAQGYLDVELDMLGFIPADEALERATHASRSVLESAPTSAAAQAFRRLADDIAGWGGTGRKRAGLPLAQAARARVA